MAHRAKKKENDKSDPQEARLRTDMALEEGKKSTKDSTMSSTGETCPTQQEE